MENIIKGIFEGSCFVLHKCAYTESNKIININGNTAYNVSNKYVQNMKHINVTTTLINDNNDKCPLQFYTYIFNDNVKLFGNNSHDIIKYVSDVDITITHTCSNDCKNRYNYHYKDNVLIQCTNIKLNIETKDYNDILDIFTNTSIDTRSYDYQLSCFNHIYINKANKDKSYLQNELLKYIGDGDIINTNTDSYTFVNKSNVYYILHV